MMDNPDDLIPTRWSLLDRLKNWEDQESWRDFFNTYWKLIYSVALKAGLSESEAQDVVQETVLTVARKLAGFKTDPSAGSFKGWLLHITRWRIGDQFRKQQRQERTLNPLSDETRRTALIESVPDPAGCNLEAVWEEEWHKNLVDAAMQNVKGKVTPKQYQIFDLLVIRKWPVRDVVRALNVNAAQVYMAKHRVSRLVRLEIEHLEKNLV